MYAKISRLFSLVFASTLIALCAPARAAVPLGVEFQVNSYTNYSQRYPSLALMPGGGFVVVWDSYYQEGDQDGVFAQRFDSLGAKLGAEFQVNSYTVGYQDNADVAVSPATGDFVVVWQSRQGQDGDGRGVFGQRFDSAGAMLGGEFQVNTTTASLQRYPAVAIESDGDFVVVWGSQAVGASLEDLFGQRFASSGARLGSEFLVNAITAGFQFNAEIAMQSGGDFVVIWQSETDADNSVGIRGQRFDSAGAYVGEEFEVNSYTDDGPQVGIAIGADAGGDFVVVWTTAASFGADSEVIGQRFESTGAKLGGEFQVNSATAGYQYTSISNWAPHAVGVEPDGDFVVVWTDSRGGEYDVFGQSFSSAGDRVGAELQLNAYTAEGQYFPAVAMGPNGGFVAAWQSSTQDGEAAGVFGRRFSSAAGPVLDIDGNGSLGALTDGLLVLRRLFGFSGTTLTAGAVGGGCTRCDGAAIEAYVDGHLAVLDVDDNGEVKPLTDGLLVLRRLFGFTGATLVSGALAGDCMRCDADQIKAYLDALE